MYGYQIYEEAESRANKFAAQILRLKAAPALWMIKKKPETELFVLSPAPI